MSAWIALLIAACSSGDPDAPSDARVDTRLDADATLDAPRDDADASDARPDATPGTWTEVGSCDAGPVPGTRCVELMVRCPDVDDLAVHVRTTTPRFAPSARMLIGNGGGGTTAVDDGGFAEMIARLVDDGFEVVRHAWSEPGWFAGRAGVRAASCRYATLLRAIAARDALPLCAVGYSGGAIEIGYALSRWDAASRLHGAVLVAGPSMSRLDLLCPSVGGVPSTECEEIATRHGLACGGALACTLQGAAMVVDSSWAPRTPCTTDDGTSLADDGALSPTTRLSFPTTRVRMVLGAEECSVAPLLYWDAIDSEKALALVPGAGHVIHDAPGGIDAIERAISDTCSPL